MLSYMRICRTVLQKGTSMALFLVFAVSLVTIVDFRGVSCVEPDERSTSLESDDKPMPSVMLTILVRNQAYILPYFLYYIEHLEYPKDRISLWIRADYNDDKSGDMIRTWLGQVETQYMHVDFKEDNVGENFPDLKRPWHWNRQRHAHLANLKQQALETARQADMDYILYVDCANLLMNSTVLTALMQEKSTVITPMLNDTWIWHAEYTNFWNQIDINGHFKRNPDQLRIAHRHIEGSFTAAMVSGTVLINLRDEKSRSLGYKPLHLNYKWQWTDDLILASNARFAKVPMRVLNRDFYGYLLPPFDDKITPATREIHFQYTKLSSLNEYVEVKRLPYVPKPQRDPPSTGGLDKIYVINLARRPERKWRMGLIFEEFNLNVTFFDAIDGKTLNETYLEENKIRTNPDYADPYHERKMKMGEIGCFLSHYKIWEEVIQNNYEKVLVFEDDAAFFPRFTTDLKDVLLDSGELPFDYEFIYLARKYMKDNQIEPFINKDEFLSFPEYTHLLLSYVITNNGARKLVAQKPLSKMIPTDEFVPIMYDKHPRDEWKCYFWPRNLVAISAQPPIVERVLTLENPAYVSDTEDSTILSAESFTRNEL